jgi:hypothetical protein
VTFATTLPATVAEALNRLARDQQITRSALLRELRAESLEEAVAGDVR